MKVSGILSFGLTGIDLPLEPLNVLIGPNGSGKSNFIEALALLQAAPRDLSAPVRRPSGISEWLWKGDDAPGAGVVDALLSYPHGQMSLRHVLEIGQQGERFEVRDERIENERPNALQTEPFFYYRFQRGDPVINDFIDELGGPRKKRELRRSTVHPDGSILSQRDDPDLYPELAWLQEQYRRIRLYRNWEFGPAAMLRQPPRADDPSTFLTERGENLPLLLSKLRGDSRQRFVESLQQLYDGIVNFQVEVGRGGAELFVVEQGAGERYIPASRLSDGTLRYMALAAILLDPDPPPLVVIEEPELGLHPDVILGVGRMLVEASRRMQLVVTTHAHALIDAMDDCPSSVVVCEKYDGESVFERLQPKYLTEWLKEYTLGNLWSAGDLGGNRW
ncbi:MAG: AAA family ATPase [Chloroflexi bacterium]|nr:AAA family ATPase [Chloroflexota bacterium]